MIKVISFVIGQDDESNLQLREFNGFLRNAELKIEYQSQPIIHKNNKTFTIIFQLKNR